MKRLMMNGGWKYGRKDEKMVRSMKNEWNKMFGIMKRWLMDNKIVWRMKRWLEGWKDGRKCEKDGWKYKNMVQRMNRWLEGWKYRFRDENMIEIIKR